LSEINRFLLEGISKLLSIETRLSWSTDYPSHGAKSELLLSVCEAAQAGEYVSGPAARAYLDEELFASRGVAVSWLDYSGYPDYPQVHPPFDPAVSILDLLFNVGSDAPRYLKHTGCVRAGDSLA
jgi:hypothetical protein